MSGANDAGPDASDGPPPWRLEVDTWWNGLDETRALQALVAVHHTLNPEVPIAITQFADEYNQREALEKRFVAGNPPGAFQANLGVSGTAWGPSVQSLDVVSSFWAAFFPPGVLDSIRYNGSLIGVPLWLRRLNVVFWNKRVLDTLALTKKIPETLPEFDAWLREVAALGYTHPICFSGKDAWVSGHVVFEHILPAIAGADFSQAYWSGQTAFDDPKLVEALAHAQKIAGYLSRNWLDFDMTAGIVKLITPETSISDQCLMTPMGDWAGSILINAHAVPGVDVVSTAWPGAARLTVFQGSGFLMPRGTGHTREGIDFFNTLASEIGQVAFCEQVGALPGRMLTQVPSTFDPFVRKNIADLADPLGKALPSYKMIGKITFPVDPLATAVRDFLQTKDMTIVLAFLRDNYIQLK